MDDGHRSREALIRELNELRQKVAELRAREFERMKREHELRREMELHAENAKTTAQILKQTLELSTETKRKLKDAEREVKDAERTKAEFLVNMSHELRTPMTAILGFTDLLIEEGDLAKAPSSRVESLQSLRRNGQGLMQILSNIFDLSQIEAGDVHVEPLVVSPRELLEDIAAVMRQGAASKGIGFDLAYVGEIPVRIRTDPVRLRQILMNLVGNAVKFTESGGVRLTVKLTETPDGPRLRFDVADTGEGLSPAAMDRIFSAFAQADGSAARKFGGAGLGLTLAQQLAAALGGELHAESLEGHGSVFRLQIDPGPLEGVEMIDPSAPDAADSDTIDDAETRHLLARIRGEGLEARVLYVEDGEDNRRLISFMLRKAGFQVTCAENGEQGVELALAARDADQLFDVILMDMQMPVMDGYEATRRLRQEGWTLPIVALTAHALDGERGRCMDAGCDVFATKPINRRELIKLVIRQLVERKPSHVEV